MGRTSDMYKKTTDLVEAYKKYHRENLTFDSYNPAEEVRMFHDEEFGNQIQIV